MLEAAADEIIKLIECIGRDVQIVTITDTGGTGWNPTQDKDPTAAKAAFAGFKAEDSDGTIIQANDVKAYLSSANPVIKANKIVARGVQYSIKGLREVGPGVDTILYIAHLRI